MMPDFMYTLDQYLVTSPFKVANYFGDNLEKFFGTRFGLYDIEVDTTALELEDDKKYIVVANHVKMKDPFIINGFFPKKELDKLSPFRYLTSSKWMSKSLMGTLMGTPLKFCGCFSTEGERNNGKSALALAQEYLDKGQTIVIFPEGKRNPDREEHPEEMGNGAAYLERNNDNLWIIPVNLSYSGPKDRNISITYRKPIRHESFKDLNEVTKEIIKHIYE